MTALAVAMLPPAAAAQNQLAIATLPATYSRVLQLPSGNPLLVGSALQPSYDLAQNQYWQLALSQFNLKNRVQISLAPFFNRGNTIPQDAALDPAGNIWVVGETDSDDFPLVNPVFAQKPLYQVAGFVIELDPAGQNVLFASYLGSARQNGSICRANATAITTDAAGNVYVGGATNEPDFLLPPSANPAYTSCFTSLSNISVYSFLVKISPAGKLVWGERLITGTSQCVGGSRCVEQMSTSAMVSNLAVDPTGAITVAGIASGSWNPGQGYILKLASDGSNVLWSTNTSSFPAVLTMSMAQDASGNIDVFGQYATLSQIPASAPEVAAKGLFAAQLKPNGSGFAYVTDLGQSPDSQAAGIVLDAAGHAYLAGTSSSSQFPTLSGVPNLGPDFVLLLDSSGATPRNLFRFPHGVVTAPPAFDKDGHLLLLGVQGALLTLTLSYNTPAIVAYANSASQSVNTGVAPGALISLYGWGLPSSVQDVQVTIGNVPAPVLFAGANQINLQVPFATSTVTGDPLPVQVIAAGTTIPLQLTYSPSLGIFTVDGTYAAALNQDGTVNSSSNPASAGSIVTLFGTGAFWPSGMQDGAVATAATPTAIPILLVDDPEVLTVPYAGAAPGLINGVLQVNVQLPQQPSLPLTLREDGTRYGAGVLSSNPVKLYLK